MKRDKNTTVNGKRYVVHIPRKIVSWKTECGLEAEKVNCIAPGDPLTDEDLCQTCVRLAQRVSQRA